MLGDDTTTEKRLRLLGAEFTQRPVTGLKDARTSTRCTAAAPLDLGTIDYMAQVVAEVVKHTRAADPDAGSFTGDAADVYAWAREHTASPEQELAREAIIYRQGLQHAVAMGDTDVVRKHPCPECGCWGLYWRAAANRAVCVNHYCTDKNGEASKWKLGHLAQQHIAGQESASRRAT